MKWSSTIRAAKLEAVISTFHGEYSECYGDRRKRKEKKNLCLKRAACIQRYTCTPTDRIQWINTVLLQVYVSLITVLQCFIVVLAFLFPITYM